MGEQAPGTDRRAGSWVGVAAVVVILAAFLPWARATVDLLGLGGGPTLDFKGVDIQSDLGVNEGWIMIALAVVALAATAQGALRLLKGVGVAAVLFSGYAALTAASHTTSISPNLEGVHARVSIGYLVIVELLAATGLLVAAMRLSRETGLVAEPPSDDVPPAAAQPNS